MLSSGMDTLPSDWIDDPDDDDDIPDLDALCSDPVSLASDQFLLMIEAMGQEGFSMRQIMAGLTLASADLACLMLGEDAPEAR